jgi:hypothetical protein
MKKSVFVSALFALTLIVGLLTYFQPITAAPTATEGQESMLAQVTNTGCAKIECGSCPGASCKIGGICCYVPGTDGAPDRDGLGECGCNADGEPVCTCKVGQPR